MEIILIVLMAGFFLLPTIAIDIEWLTYLPWWVCLGIGVIGIIWMVSYLFRPEEMTNNPLGVLGAVFGSVAYMVVGLHKYKQREIRNFRK